MSVPSVPTRPKPMVTVNSNDTQQGQGENSTKPKKR